MKTGIELIAEERKRQIEVEGYVSKNDDIYWSHGELADAASCYAMDKSLRTCTMAVGDTIFKSIWPWSDACFKPTPDNRIKELVKAGALIVAEIDRLQRLKEDSPSQA